jgi:hypothetical protein
MFIAYNIDYQFSVEEGRDAFPRDRTHIGYAVLEAEVLLIRKYSRDKLLRHHDFHLLFMSIDTLWTQGDSITYFVLLFDRDDIAMIPNRLIVRLDGIVEYLVILTRF